MPRPAKARSSRIDPRDELRAGLELRLLGGPCLVVAGQRVALSAKDAALPSSAWRRWPGRSAPTAWRSAPPQLRCTSRREKAMHSKRNSLPALAALMVAALAIASQASAQGGAATRPLLKKYIGNPDTDALLKEPAVRAQLEAMLGKQLPRLIQNLNVRGDVELVGGALALSGNAPHKGGEEEAVVCIADQGPVPFVEAAIFSKGKVTIFSKGPQYDNVMICVKDWVTQVNSGHRDRMTQPKNVQLIAKP
ncbi:MAG: hypothetical protein ABI699_00955 [Caldimonas sp.]